MFFDLKPYQATEVACQSGVNIYCLKNPHTLTLTYNREIINSKERPLSASEPKRLLKVRKKELIKTMLVDAPLLGFLVWLMGYLAGIALYFVFRPDVLGWVLFVIFTPIVAFLCYWRFRKRKEAITYYVFVAAVWLIVAVVFDYVFLVRLLNPPVYYKLDVYVYYASTFLIPFLVGAKFGSKRLKSL